MPIKSYVKNPTQAQLARRRGMARQRAGVQRQVELAVIVAAFARGWTREQIGFAAGVSQQRITQRLDKYEAAHGPIAVRERWRHKSTAVKVNWRCAGCGQSYWAMSSIVARGGREMFCSTRCQSDHDRLISDAMIAHAIDLRWAGKSWTSVAITLGYPQQSIQTRMWKYLYQLGMLDLETVESIWKPRHYHRAAWNWLERTTGLIATETGARLGKRLYRDRPTRPWGRSYDRVRSGADPS